MLQVLGRCALAGRWRRVFDLTRQAEGDHTTASTCRIACAKAAMWELPLELLRQRLLPDLIDFGASLSACEMAGRWRESLELPLGKRFFVTIFQAL